MIPQSRTEAILAERLAELGGTVRWSSSAASLAPDRDADKDHAEDADDVFLCASSAVRIAVR